MVGPRRSRLSPTPTSVPGPGYPEDAVRWLVGEEPRDVVDLGAGTGKLTRVLVALGHRVTAVEPLPEMIARLLEAVPGVTAVEGGAEAIPLPAASADVVTAAQAFHWFDHGPALREIARVLRPGGSLALVWNTRDDREPWVAQLSEEAIGRETVEEGDAAAPVEESGLFGAVERASFPHAQQLDRERLDRPRSLAELLRRAHSGGAGAGARRSTTVRSSADGSSCRLTECFRADGSSSELRRSSTSS